MKSNRKTKTIILIILGILITFAPIFINNQWFTAKDRYITSNYDNEFYHKNLKISKVSGKIHIINNSGWVDFRNAGNCSGSGTYSDPYIIENLEINGGDSGNCILIENSNVYFKIENCYLYNAGWGSDAGIRLLNVNNSQLIGNDCSSSFLGIDISYGGYNNTITGNLVNNNGGGIHLFECYNNTVSGNTENNNLWCGIYILGCNYTIISGNTMNNNSIHGIQLSGGHNNIISGNTMNDNIMLGLLLEDSNNNIVSRNTAINNYWDGIYFQDSDSNYISENIVDSNRNGLYLHYDSENNTIILNCLINNIINAWDKGLNNRWDNGSIGNYWDDYIGSDSDGDGIGDVPYTITGSAGSQDNFPLIKCALRGTGGFPIEMIILISVISGGAVISVATLLLIGRKRKRIE
jgi:parallel beta-helix repeat protein